MAIPQIPVVATPTLFDKVLNAFNTKLVGELSWLNHAFGQAQKCTRILDNNTEIIYPAVYAGKNESDEYTSVLPDEFLGDSNGVTGFSWIDINDIDHEATNPQMSGRVTANVGIVFWFNLNEVLNDSAEYRNLDLVVAQCLAAIKASNRGFQGSIVVDGWTVDADEIYTGYSLREDSQKFLMQPFAGIRFNCTVTFFDSSCLEVQSVAPLAITNLTYSNDAQSIAEADPFVSMAPALTPSQRAKYKLSVLDTLPSFLTLNESTGVISDNGTTKSISAYSFSILVIVSNQIADTYEVTVTVIGAAIAEWELSDLASGKEMHLDARIIGNLLESAGTPMVSGDIDAAGFTDQFANANYSPQLETDPQTKPLWKESGINGLGALVLDNTAGFQIDMTATLATPFSIFFATNLQLANGFMMQNSAGTTLHIQMISNSSVETLYIGSGGGIDSYAIPRAEQLAIFNEAAVWEFHFESGSNASYVKVNQGEALSWSFTILDRALDSFYLFMKNNRSGGWVGLVQQAVIISGSNFTGDNYDAINARLAHDMGIQSDLPVANPYKVTMKPAP